MLATPFHSFGQGLKVYRIGYLANQLSPRTSSNSFKAFVGALQELGWTEGKNIEIRVRSSGGRDELFADYAAEFVRENVDVIVTTGSASTQAAKAVTSSIPIVFGSIANPVEQKVIASLARPGGNVTGMAIMAQELGPKRLQLLKEIQPGASRAVRLYSASGMIKLEPILIDAYNTAGHALGVTLDHIPVTEFWEFEAALVAAKRNRIDAIIVEADAIFVVNRFRVAALALKYRLPMMCGDVRFVEAGALVAYSENFPSRYRRAAFFVDKILRGAKPADLPVELATGFELAVNLTTARTLEITIPESVRLMVNRTIN
ncbi:MAG: ABC transporter substrate-binding protein [Burkholderiales bacterium]